MTEFDYKDEFEEIYQQYDFPMADNLPFPYEILELMVTNNFPENQSEFDYQADISHLTYMSLHNMDFPNHLWEQLVNKLLLILSYGNKISFQSFSLTLDLLSSITKNYIPCQIILSISEINPSLRSDIDNFMYPPIMERIIRIFHNFEMNNIPFESILFFGGLTFCDLLSIYIESGNDFILSTKLIFFVDRLDQHIISIFLSKIISKFNNFQISENDLYKFCSLLSDNHKTHEEFITIVFPHFLVFFYQVAKTTNIALINAALCILCKYLKFGTFIKCEHFLETEKIFLTVFDLDIKSLGHFLNFKKLLKIFLKWAIQIDNFIMFDDEQANNGKIFLEKTVEKFLTVLQQLIYIGEEGFIGVIFMKIAENTSERSWLREWFLLCEELLDNVLENSTEEQIQILQDTHMIDDKSLIIMNRKF